ncbi:cadherin-7-like, partial [Oculina patagonica]
VYFQQPTLQLQLNESTPPGTFVGRVQAKAEVVSSDQITYSLRKDQGWFKINSTSGVITVAKTLDREETATGVLQFEAIASKSDEISDGIKYIICTVLDLNDNYPQFENLPYQVNISENTKVGELVFQVSATDRDSSLHHHNEVFFRIAGGNTGDIFEMGGSNGKITLKKPLDFEGSTTYYNLNITATDKHGAPTGNQNWTVVTIGVTDTDDLPAKFSQYLYEVLIEVDTPQGSEIVRVHAEDQDSVKAPVSYAIYPESDPDELFKISNVTGLITLNRNLSRDTYPLIVT